MRIGLNAIGVRPGTVEGVFLRALVFKLRDMQTGDSFVVYTDSGNEDLFRGAEQVSIYDGPVPMPGVPEKQIDRAVRESRVERLLTPLETAPNRSSVPITPFCMDFEFLLPQWQGGLRNDHPRAKDFKRVASMAFSFIVPSDQVKKDLLATLNVPLNKVVVAHVGVDECVDAPQPSMVEQPYMLTVGDTRGLSNHPELFDAFNRLLDEIPHNIVLMGQSYELELPKWEHRVLRIQQLPMMQRAGLYQNSDFVLAPAAYDGSAMAVLEAMRSGGRVVATRKGGVPEMSSSVPILFDPDSPFSMLSGARKAMNESPSDREQRVRIGKQTAQQYTWEKCAWRVLTALQREPD